ncbi:formimidoylglutamate deiminase [Hwanghaeella grinnelliae]|uniref:Formimidoylglutamate deiminase n=1 Tax=Hwanghaeella grinnelliae TaxID=2500179 RepID=A0A437QVS7_9PROT|nr:formimidoylglutamate deiminase [Hwanghaeella grinnelliae]RVU38579.1 formimidoylglutamate deiminase [Hwanghaeella grinnelliae]
MELFTPSLMTPTGWRSNSVIRIEDGWITAIENADHPPNGAEKALGPVLPGMPNLHSHAFQRAMAGLTERWGSPTDSFWSWRDLMYRFVGRLTPDDIRTIALQLYIECLKQGYTAVAEFHYLHNQAGGESYDNPAETSLQILAAAQDAGIGLTHLPVLYAHGGFGNQPLGEAQARFRTDPERILEIAAAIRSAADGSPDIAVGAAPHSLRAADPDMIADLAQGLRRIDPAAPLHIHIAEQVKEVEDCLAWCGKRPVDLLADTQDLDDTWCLVHATHLTDAETTRIAESGAIAGLCPTTEASLGDGLFPLVPYRDAKGAFGIGSDSHVCRDPAEELRLLEYGQRLTLRARNIAASELDPSTGGSLWRAAVAGGAKACGRSIAGIEVGQRADLVVLNGTHTDLTGRTGDAVTDTVVFSGGHGFVRDVMVGGKWTVKDGRHALEEKAADDFRLTLTRLLA